MGNNWYVITGGPSTGKTTLLAELDKLGYRVVPESARMVIDEGIAQGLSVEQIRGDEEAFQHEVLRVKQKVEGLLDPSVLTFLDRGMHDNVAYAHANGFKIEPWMEELFERSHYKKVFLLEPLDGYVKDYARTEDEEFIKKIPGILHEAYTQYGMKPISIPPVNIEERVKLILAHVKQENADD